MVYIFWAKIWCGLCFVKLHHVVTFSLPSVVLWFLLQLKNVLLFHFCVACVLTQI